MTTGSLVLFAALLFEDDDLRVSPVVYDRGSDASAVNHRRSDLRFVAAEEQHVQLNAGADLFVHEGHANLLALFHAELFTAASDNCVSHNSTPYTQGERFSPPKSLSL